MITCADVDALICRSAEIAFVACTTRRCCGQSVGIDGSQVEFYLREFRKKVGEEQRETISLVGGARHFHAIEVLLRFHQRDTNPRIGSGHKLTEEFHIESGDISARLVAPRIHHLEVVDFVRDEIGKILVVQFSRKFERAFHRAERIVGSGNYMDASLRLDVVVEHHDGVSIVVGYLFAVFFIEWCLIIHTCGESHRESFVERRHESHARTRTHEELLVVVPIGTAHTSVYHPQSHPALHLVGVLGKEREAVRRQIVARRHIIYYIHTGAIDRERIARRVAHFPLALAVVDVFVHEIDAVGEVVEVYRCVSSQSEVENAHFQPCAGMFVIFSHTELTADGVFAVGSGFVEPIFARDVVCHKFVGEVSRCKEREIARFVVPVIEGEGAEIGLEFVFFLSVEIHGELLGIVGCAETGASILGGEAVVVHRDIAEESHLHLLAEAQVEVGLIVEILRVIFPLGLKGAEQRTVALVANAV